MASSRIKPLGGAGGPNPSNDNFHSNNGNANIGAVRNRTLRGIGSYGAVVSPAIDNIINGEIHKFPNKVTKLLFRKNSYNKTLHNMRVIKEIVPELAYNIHPYVRNIRLKDIRNEAVREKIVERFQKKGIPATDVTPLYGVRMNDMGHDLFDMYSIEELQIYLLTHVPFMTIVDNMKKVAETVHAIYDAGYIHGDIRDANVLCNVNTGELRVIDFDFLHSVGRPELEYYRMKYSYPIESYIINNTDNLLNYIKDKCINSDISIDTIYEEIDAIARTHINTHYSDVKLILINDKISNEDELQGILVEGYKNAIIKLIQTIRETPVERRSAECEIRLTKSYNDTCDSYGLGIAFIFYISGIQQQVQHIPIVNEKLQELWRIAFGMVSSNFVERVTIVGAIDYIGKLFDEMNEADNLQNALSAPASSKSSNILFNNNYMGEYNNKLTNKHARQSKKLTRRLFRKYKLALKKTHRNTHKLRSTAHRTAGKSKYSRQRKGSTSLKKTYKTMHKLRSTSRRTARKSKYNRQRKGSSSNE